MRFTIHPRKEAPFLALFDVGATSVGVSLAVLEQGTTTLLWSNRLHYSYVPDADYAHYERSMYAALLEAGMKLVDEGVREARKKHSEVTASNMRAACVLAPPWFFGTVTTAVKSWSQPTPVTGKLHDTLMEEVKNQASSSDEALSWRTVVGDAEDLEVISLKTQLNGYPVDSFEGQKVLQASVTGYVALVANDIHAHVKEILERILPNHDVLITTSTYTIARLYQTTMGSGAGNQGYIVELGGHVTSIATIQGGILMNVSTIPLGTHDILSAAAPKAITSEEARSALFMLVKKGAQGSTSLPPEVESELSAWHSAICEAFRHHSNGTVPFELVYLLAGKDWVDLLTPVLKRPWSMPGVREEHTQAVTPISVMVERPNSEKSGQSGREKDDSRLMVFSHSLFYTVGA